MSALTLKHGIIGQDAERLHARFKILFNDCNPENIDQAIENRYKGAPRRVGPCSSQQIKKV